MNDLKKVLTLTLSVILVNIIAAQNLQLSKYVNPFIGTGGHGHTYPGATLPFGMVQLSPDTRIDGSWDGCSGYHYSDSIIYGFSHTHLNGTGCSDFGDIILFPSSAEITKQQLASEMISTSFKHSNESASAGYYSVLLDNGVKAELTATTRVGFHKYTFPKQEFGYIVLDLELRDKVISSSAELKGTKKITGFRQSEAWAKDQLLMYDLEFSQDFIDAYIADGSVMQSKEPISGTKVRICFKFKLDYTKSVMAKVALSPVTVEGAEKNMAAELPLWDFAQTKAAAAAAWDKELSKIIVESKVKKKLTVFYTALYHTMIQPNIAMDVDGTYRGRDGKAHKAEGFTYYSVFSLWDTFRAAHPLYTVIDQKRTADFINTFLAQYEQGGRLPVWELASNETDCMIGYHSVSVMADAMVKGIKGFNYDKAYQAAKHSAGLDHYGLAAYKKNGCISVEDEHESVSKTLEYAYDDWCISQMALITGNEAESAEYLSRSQYWMNVFDPQTGFMRAKKNGRFLEPFEPREVNNNFTEGNSWQYSFFVPHDVEGLIRKMGGPEKFEAKLDELFSAPQATTGREQADITGLIGQYAHGNEPSHHMAYLYNYVGKPWKTQKRVHGILTDFYKDQPDGLIGNEDCGQMSAWYVLSSLGLYQVTPGSGYFTVGCPLFSSATINLENGKKMELRVQGDPSISCYLQSDEESSPSMKITYQEIINGTKLRYSVAAVPDLKTGKYDVAELFPGVRSKTEFIPSPIITTKSRLFKTLDTVKISSEYSKGRIYYTLSGAQPHRGSLLYTVPFVIDKTTVVKAIVIDEENSSFTSTATLYKLPHPEWKVTVKSKVNPQYTAGGADALIDGIAGSTNWKQGEWQGYQYQDFECVLELDKEKSISSLSSTYLQDTRAWIILPSKVSYYISNDNVTYTLCAEVNCTVDAKNYDVQVLDFRKKLDKSVKAKYVKVVASNFGKLPEWHQGFGDSAFIFVDELRVE
jgi:predicted alpha-1,2-mannosidase